MKLVVYGSERKLGALQGDQVIDLNLAYAKYLKESQNEPLPYEMASAVVPAELGDFIVSGPRAIEGAQKAVEHVTRRASDQRGLRGERLIEPQSDIKTHAPYARRARIMMAGGNFVIHSQGMGFRTGEGTPPSLDEVYKESRKRGIWGFYCFTENAAGPDEDVIYPARTDRLDYEGEVAVILGKAGKDIRPADGKQYIWGFMLQNDISARTNISGADNRQSSFARGKNFDTSVCGGPCVVIDEIPDCHNVTWETRVNGELRQTGNTKDMTFNFYEYLEYMSADMMLRPGDVISAGTTAGTAQDSSDILEGPGDGGQPIRDPKRFLKPGDVVEISNPIIGTLRNRIVAKSTT
ncbi:MAG TPA: fumarylacetoacetate hydrolase family protein [Dehalococcoidia bacterium]|nr:fumarylacetoacetate hydrolase family protein [Dehalococcoidia bacterium]